MPRSRSAVGACAPLGVDEALRSLHDDVAPELFVARSALVQLGTALPADTPEHERAQLALIGIQRALQRTSELVSGLRASEPADEADLAAGLQRALIEVAAPAGMAVRYDEAGSGADLPQASVPPLVGIVREAVANAAAHGEASEIRVSVRRSARCTRIAVADNGRGFGAGEDPEPVRHAGWGLSAVARRARAIGARVTLASRPGAGVVLLVEVPHDGITGRGH